VEYISGVVVNRYKDNWHLSTCLFALGENAVGIMVGTESAIGAVAVNLKSRES
jgi:hypothetical protein